jgi:SPP1 family phage portal protein
MGTELLLTDDVNKLAELLPAAIQADRGSTEKIKAREGLDYYKGKHKILDNRIFYIDDEGQLKEDRFASNIRIAHQFLTEIVDQKVQYLLSLPIEYTVNTDDETYKAYLSEYYDDDFQLFMQELIEGASQKGCEYAYVRTTSEDKIKFEVADSLGVFPVYDQNNEVKKICRYYEKVIYKNNQAVTLLNAELWNDKNVIFFTSEGGTSFKLDESRIPNPKPHILATDEKGKYAGREYGFIPFYRFANNKLEKTDLEPIKSLIDDYDVMNAFLSNNLQDFAEAIYVVSGFLGDDLSKLRQNIKSKKVVATGEGGNVDIKTVNIPVEGRKTKMDLDRENIYKFGMAFDSAQIGDGNITNIVIKSRYSLLNMKANKTEVRLKTLLKWVNEIVTNDINRRYNKAYDPANVSFTITREIMVNENDLAQNELTKANKQQVIINSILAAAPKIDDESVLKLLCEQFDLDWEEVQERLEEQGTKIEEVTDKSDPEEELEEDTLEPLEEDSDNGNEGE